MNVSLDPENPTESSLDEVCSLRIDRNSFEFYPKVDGERRRGEGLMFSRRVMHQGVFGESKLDHKAVGTWHLCRYPNGAADEIVERRKYYSLIFENIIDRLPSRTFTVGRERYVLDVPPSHNHTYGQFQTGYFLDLVVRKHEDPAGETKSTQFLYCVVGTELQPRHEKEYSNLPEEVKEKMRLECKQFFSTQVYPALPLSFKEAQSWVETEPVHEPLTKRVRRTTG